MNKDFSKAESIGTKRKSRKMGFHQTKELLHSRGNSQQSEDTTDRMGEHIDNFLI